MIELYISLASVIILFLIFLFVAARLAYRLAFFSDRERPANPYKYLDGDEEWQIKTRERIDSLLSTEYTDLYITSRDGLRLHAYYKPGREGAPLAIMCHGYRSTPFSDFSGGATVAMEKGFSVLLIDQRAHGKSEGKTISFGILERYDMLEWAHFMREKFSPSRIILFGVSMGAATVLMAGALPLPPEVVGIVADCPFSSPVKIIGKVSAEKGFPSWLFRLPTLVAARLFGGFNLLASSPAQAIKDCTLPVLLIHGDADGYVPHKMSLEIYAAREDNTTHLTFEGADHARSFVTDTEKYKKALLDFEDKILGG